MNDEFIMESIPVRLNDRYDLDKILSHMVSIDGSDLFLKSGDPLRCQRYSKKEFLSKPTKFISEAEVLNILKDLYGVNAQARLGNKDPLNEAYEFTEQESGERKRFRVNASSNLAKGRGAYTVTFRSIPTKPPLPSGVPEEILDVCTMSDQGLILVVGATGNGKSTLLASILRYMLEDEDANKNLITLEAPIEFVYDDVVMPSSFVTQMQIGKHIKSFSEGVENTLRMAPNVILVGEARDYETISAAIEASITGHVVFSTVHANDVSQTIPRMISTYPLNKQRQALTDLMGAVKMIIAQRLVEKVGGGRIPIREYLIFDNKMRAEICEAENLTTFISDAIQENGTSMLDDAQAKLENGLISQSTFDRLKINYG